MPRKANALPSYLLHKQSGQARVRIDGKDILLGAFGSDESRIRYGELISQRAGGVLIDPIAGSKRGSLPRNETEADPGPSVAELCAVFLRHAEQHYQKNGQPTSELFLYRSAMRPLKELYGVVTASEFGPLALAAVRQRMIELGWCRTTINRAMRRICKIFRHAVKKELVKADCLTRLEAVDPLLAGRTEAHDNAPRTAVSDADIDAVKNLVSPLVCDLIDLQRLTGARSGELLQLTTRMIDRSGQVWHAVLANHKTLHRGKSRTLYFGPRSQLILKRHLAAAQDSLLFPVTRCAYCRAITRACEKAGIPRWVPHQLRHTAGTLVRDEFGLEHTQALLGHSKAESTQRYAQLLAGKAIEVARRMG